MFVLDLRIYANDSSNAEVGLGLERHEGGCFRGRSAQGFDGFEATPQLVPVTLAEATEAFDNRTDERYGRMVSVVGRRRPGSGP